METVRTADTTGRCESSADGRERPRYGDNGTEVPSHHPFPPSTQSCHAVALAARGLVHSYDTQSARPPYHCWMPVTMGSRRVSLSMPNTVSVSYDEAQREDPSAHIVAFCLIQWIDHRLHILRSTCILPPCDKDHAPRHQLLGRGRGGTCDAHDVTPVSCAVDVTGVHSYAPSRLHRLPDSSTI